MNIRKFADSIEPGRHTYRIGFQYTDDNAKAWGLTDDETEVNADDMDDLAELWESLAPEFHVAADSVTYVEVNDYEEEE